MVCPGTLFPNSRGTQAAANLRLQRNGFGKDFTSDNVWLLPFWILQDNVDQTFSNSYEFLLTTLRELCLDSFWMKIPLSFQHPLPNKRNEIRKSTVTRLFAGIATLQIRSIWFLLPKHHECLKFSARFLGKQQRRRL